MTDQPLDRPILLMSAGRSGSTLLQRILSFHPDIGTPTSWTNRFPSQPWLAIGGRLRSASWEARGRHPRFYPGPSEAEGIWHHCFPRFWHDALRATPNRDDARRFREVCARLLRAQGRARLLLKLSGPPIFAFMRKVFPDIQCMWLDRDPRAVVSSYLRKGWLGSGVRSEGLSKRERLDLAIDNYLNTYRRRCASEPDLTLRYEDFVVAPRTSIEILSTHLGLTPSRSFSRLVARWEISTTTNEGWKRDLPRAEREHAEHRLAETIEDLGYSLA